MPRGAFRLRETAIADILRVEIVLDTLAFAFATQASLRNTAPDMADTTKPTMPLGTGRRVSFLLLNPASDSYNKTVLNGSQPLDLNANHVTRFQESLGGNPNVGWRTRDQHVARFQGHDGG